MKFPQTLAVESWTLYALAVLVVAARIGSRCIKTNSFKQLRVEEYLMIFLTVIFTADMWAINVVAVNGSNYMSDEEAAALTPEGVQRAIWGSKMTLALEMFTLATEWGCKFCLIILYLRFVEGLDNKKPFVKFVGVFCVLGYLLITVLLLTLWCHPIDEYWRVPVKISQCATYYHHMIFATAFNIASDLMLLSIPIPIIVRAQLPLKRKIVLVCILGLGVFNILATILNRYYNFSNPNSIEYLNWYVGEVTTAVIVTNLPLTWPLIRKVFHLSDWASGGGGSPGMTVPQNTPIYTSYTTDGSDSGESCGAGKARLLRAYFRRDGRVDRRRAEESPG